MRFMASQTNEGMQDVEKLVREYQMVQEQLRSATMQLDQLQGQKAELKRANEEITASAGKVYITVGGVIVETTKEKALADLKERSELTEVRLTSITKQFNDFKAREEKLGEKLTQMYKQSQGSGGS